MALAACTVTPAVTTAGKCGADQSVPHDQVSSPTIAERVQRKIGPHQEHQRRRPCPTGMPLVIGFRRPQLEDFEMPLFVVTTIDGKEITVEHSEATPQAVVNQAKSAQVLSGQEVHHIAGKERKTLIAIPWHAIAVVRPKE
jgi:hypothetical protein